MKYSEDHIVPGMEPESSSCTAHAQPRKLTPGPAALVSSLAVSAVGLILSLKQTVPLWNNGKGDILQL